MASTERNGFNLKVEGMNSTKGIPSTNGNGFYWKEYFLLNEMTSTKMNNF